MFRTEDIIDEITQWIDSRLHKPMKIEDISARAGYSKWHLQRIFVQVKEVSLGKYIRDKKLKLAAKDLIETNEPLMGIACKYGFDSQQTFTRVFFKKYKLPPLRYRHAEKRKKH
ncbi:helix-turn-helix domain-containing protein [Klebsiella michiganensis]|uniref:helix-turn-helix domain-containing protein n=1 Tax=Klebsiella michiganensis TaxID=1134687 RepID=UPI00190D0552|nr:helix-turn-helix domain-containing protein [Klebsiella michiganensis]QQO68341.1 helix-turn-helix domain-containing protein [Klebsiella michiganensis]